MYEFSPVASERGAVHLFRSIREPLPYALCCAPRCRLRPSGGGCDDLPTEFNTSDFSSTERTFAPGDTGTLALRTGWTLRVDATGAPEPYRVTLRDTPRRDFPPAPSASIVEVLYAAESGRADEEPSQIEVRFQLSREFASSFVPRAGNFLYASAPPRAISFGFLPNTCTLVAGSGGKRVRLVAAFQVGPDAARDGGRYSFGSRAHLGIAPYLYRRDYLPACTAEGQRILAQQQSGGPATTDVAAQLERLAKLKADRALTEEEFQTQKRKLLE